MNMRPASWHTYVYGLLFALLLTVPATAQTLAEKLGYAADAKLLIVHTDDIGVSQSVNRASFDALATGLVNSGSIMVPCPWFPEVVAYAKDHPEADLGLHLTLTAEWKYYRWRGVHPDEQAASLYDDQGFMYASVEEVVQHADPAAVEREIRAQVERAMAFGLDPTHLDSHMGTLFQLPFFNAYLKVGQEYKLPILLPRDAIEQQAPQLLEQLSTNHVLIDHLAMAPGNLPADQWHDFYTNIVENLQPGVSEIIIHVGYDDEELQAVTVDHPEYGSAWRQRDYDFFTSDHFAQLLEKHDIKLVTWREIRDKVVRWTP